MLIWAVLLGALNSRAQELITSGVGCFPFEDAAKRTITVWYYAPSSINPSTPILFVMHGVERNGREYRDAWTEHAKKKSAILLVPEFSTSAFPGSDEYSLGDVFSSTGSANDRNQWGFTSIERIFKKVVADAKLTTRGYSIYGHSAGAQFVHRMVLFLPEAHIEKAVAANAGWYTMPDFRTPFPYGLKGTPVTPDNVRIALQKKLTILLGAEDTDENHKHLRKSVEANTQGKNRLERGKTFFKQGGKQAAKFGVPFEWNIKIVPGVGHSNSGMTQVAADMVF